VSGFDQERAPLADRRQRAREAFWDMLHDQDLSDGPVFELSDCVTGAIDTATRVRVDGQIMAHVFPLVEGRIGLRDAEQIIAAAFRAAGFEVEE
jgi:hypothetical protein